MLRLIFRSLDITLLWILYFFFFFLYVSVSQTFTLSYDTSRRFWSSAVPALRACDLVLSHRCRTIYVFITWRIGRREEARVPLSFLRVRTRWLIPIIALRRFSLQCSLAIFRLFRLSRSVVARGPDSSGKALLASGVLPSSTKPRTPTPGLIHANSSKD